MNLIISALTKLFNFRIRDSVFPKILKVSKVVPVFKKGSTNELTNYRPISVIPILSKLLEKTLSNRISNFFESHKLFTECQVGLRNEKSTTMAINKLVELVNASFDDGYYCGTLFCDLTKAFDCVSSNILALKLKYYKFSSESVNLIHSYLTDRSQLVSLNGKSSKLCRVHYGVPQGSILGPLICCC